MFSESKKYKTIIEDDDSGEKTTYEIWTSTEKTVHKRDKYKIVKLIRVEDNHIIYQYKKENAKSYFNNFVKIRDEEWWFDGRNYMLKLFVNCDTGEIYDDYLNMEESEYYKDESEFIWTGPCKISPDGNYMLMDGCIWACPYETKLYDISNLSKGYKEVDICDHLIDEDIVYYIEYYDEDEDAFEFISDSKLKIIRTALLK